MGKTMRTEQEMMKLILGYAEGNPHVRIASLEGSRANCNAPRDEFQDYDITFIVDSLSFFIKDDAWLNTFGNIIMLQKPEAMELFPPEILGYSYLMLFDDYNKMDLTLVPLADLGTYLENEKLAQILLDKDNVIKEPPVPDDSVYHIAVPSQTVFNDCCNEFWNTSLYVVKGLCRGEIIYAIDHLEIVRRELLRMISWQVGIQSGFHFSLGKNYKYLDRYLAQDQWQDILNTYQMGSYEEAWNALFICHELFRYISKKVGSNFGYPYPPYDRNVSKYTEDFYWKYYEINAGGMEDGEPGEEA